MVGRQRPGALLPRLVEANPWWSSVSWRDADPYLSIAAQAPFERRPAILDDIVPPNLYTLRGPRRAGKSTVLKQTVVRLIEQGIDPRRICFFSADGLHSSDDLIVLFETARDLFPDLDSAPRYFLLDEITSVSEWQRGIKWLRDNTQVSRHCIVATGSSARDIDLGAGYLAGRRGSVTGLDRLLLPLSFPEFLRCAGYDLPAAERLPLAAFFTQAGRDACQQALLRADVLIPAFEMYLRIGGFPQAVADFRLRGSVSDALVFDLWQVLQTDLRHAGLNRPEEALRLMERISAYLSGPLIFRTLAGELDVSHPTVSDWLNALADAYLVLILFQEDDGAPDLRRQRKVYPIDPLLAHVPSRQASSISPPELSRLAEAVLAVALYRSQSGPEIDRFGRPSRLFWYRSHRGVEIDFIVPAATAGDRYAAESKYVDEVTMADGRAMETRLGKGLLLTRGDFAIHPGITVIPASIFAWLLDQHDP